MSEDVLLSLGTNTGDRLETLTAAVFVLDDVEGLAVADVSGVYETPPWPPPGEPGSVEQPPFYNLVVRGVTTLEPHALLAELQLIEAAFGRDRDREVRWGPRTLDIDLLLHGDREIDTPDLVVPHPRMAERAFVLVPLLEVMPGGALPDGRRLASLLGELAPIEGIELVLRLDDVPHRRVPRPEGPRAPDAYLADDVAPTRRGGGRTEPRDPAAGADGEPDG